MLVRACVCVRMCLYLYVCVGLFMYVWRKRECVSEGRDEAGHKGCREAQRWEGVGKRNEGVSEGGGGREGLF